MAKKKQPMSSGKAKVPLIIGGVAVLLLIAVKMIFFSGGTVSLNTSVSSAILNSQIQQANGTITLDSASGAKAVTGKIQYANRKPTVTSTADSFAVTAGGKKDVSEIHLPTDVAHTVQVELGNGSMDVNLRQIQASEFIARLGNGNIVVTVPENNASKGTVALGNGNLYLKFPKKIDGVRLIFTGPVPELNFGDNAEKTDDGYQTVGYTEGENNAEVTVTIGNGQIFIDTVE